MSSDTNAVTVKDDNGIFGGTDKDHLVKQITGNRIKSAVIPNMHGSANLSGSELQRHRAGCGRNSRAGHITNPHQRPVFEADNAYGRHAGRRRP